TSPRSTDPIGRAGAAFIFGARPTTLAAGSTAVGAIMLAPLLLTGGPLLPATAAVAGWVLYLGVGTMALAYLALYAGLRTVPASTATVASLLEPVTAALLAWLVLGEHLSAAGVVGTLLVLAAVAGLARTGQEMVVSS
ncbi:EamA family transporter, partial [Nocardioides sp.]|uniref:EamA family transporter n=1 Tax=Nocardioides sp. TaxID=35761 RepID=UPI0039E6D3C0